MLVQLRESYKDPKNTSSPLYAAEKTPFLPISKSSPNHNKTAVFACVSRNKRENVMGNQLKKKPEVGKYSPNFASILPYFLLSSL